MAWKQQELYWTYKTGPIPTVEEALALGAVALGTTEDEWCKLSPGMRREWYRKLAKQGDGAVVIRKPWTSTDYANTVAAAKEYIELLCMDGRWEGHGSTSGPDLEKARLKYEHAMELYEKAIV